MRRSLVVAATAVVAGWIVAPAALAVCRVVEPYEDTGEPVTFDPTTAAIFVMAPDQLVDYRCPERPAAEVLRTGSGLPQMRLSPRFPDLGPDLGDRSGFEAPDYDPSRCWDGSEAEPVHGELVHVVVRPAIYASGGTAGLIMPIPRRADVHVAPDGLFDAVAAQQQALVEETVQYTEDPDLGWQCGDPHYSALEPGLVDDVLGAPMMLMGCGDSGEYYRPGLDTYEVEEVESGDGTVRLERIPTTEDYEVTVLNASSLDALSAWMDDNGFRHEPVDDNAFAAYVGEGAWFMAVKVTPQDLEGERVALAPLVVTWQGDTIPVMNRLQYQPDGGMLITDAYVMGPTRMEAADGDGTTLYAAPASFGADPMLRGFGLEEGWLTHIEIVRRTHEVREDSFIAPAAFEEVVRPIIYRRLDVRIAAACCPGNSYPDRDGVRRTFVENRSYVEGQGPGDESLFYRTPAPDEAYCSGGDRYDEASPYPTYACSVDDQRSQRRLMALGSWLPLLLAFGALWARRKRR